MINTRIFKTLLECAHDLDVLHFEKTSAKHSFTLGKKKTEQECYILTNDGLVEIAITEEVILGDEKPTISFSAKFKSDLRTIQSQQIQQLIHQQLETEAFLSVDDYENVNCSCEPIL